MPDSALTLLLLLLRLCLLFLPHDDDMRLRDENVSGKMNLPFNEEGTSVLTITNARWLQESGRDGGRGGGERRGKIIDANSAYRVWERFLHR